MAEKERTQGLGRAFPMALRGLWGLFPLDGLGPIPRVRAVAGESLPEPYRRLLVHDQHMTVALREHHGSDVVLHVRERRLDQSLYARRLVLTASGTGVPVLFGIMRIDLNATPAAAREEILSERTPLGAILIAHRVLRTIEPMEYLEIEPTPLIDRELQLGERGPIYGRLAAIHCNGIPAVDLFEVVRA